MTDQTMTKVRMTEGRKAAPDGVEVVLLNEREDYVLPSAFARKLVDRGYAEKLSLVERVVDAVLPSGDGSNEELPPEEKGGEGPDETKDGGDAPENKSAGRNLPWGKKD